MSWPAEAGVLFGHGVDDIVLVELCISWGFFVCQQLGEPSSHLLPQVTAQHVHQDIQPRLKGEGSLAVVVVEDEFEALEGRFAAEEDGVQQQLVGEDAAVGLSEELPRVRFVDGQQVGDLPAVHVLLPALPHLLYYLLHVQHRQTQSLPSLLLYLILCPIPQQRCLLLNCLDLLVLHLFIPVRSVGFKLGVGDDVGLLGEQQVFGVEVDESGPDEIGEDGLFLRGVGAGGVHACEGYELALGDLLEVLGEHALGVVAEDADHFVDFIGGELLVHAAHEEGEVVEGQHAVVVDVDHLEGLPDLLLRVEVAVDVVPRALQVEGALVGDVLLSLFGRLILPQVCRHRSYCQTLSSGAVDLDGVEHFAIAAELVDQTVVMPDARNARKRIMIFDEMPRHFKIYCTLIPLLTHSQISKADIDGAHSMHKCRGMSNEWLSGEWLGGISSGNVFHSKIHNNCSVQRYSQMLNPKLVPLHRNLPDIIDKKDLYALRKGLLPAHNPSFVQLEKIRELILNTHTLPVEILLENAEGGQISLLVTASNITAKSKLKSCSFPLQAGRLKWLKIALTCEFRKAEVRNKFNENKISKSSVYASTNAWKNENPEEKLSITHYSIQALLESINEKTNEGNEGKVRGGIAGLVRAKFSERANSFSHKESLGARKKIDNSIHASGRGEGSIEGISGGKKFDSTTLNVNSFYQNREKLGKRTANTSNSVRSESHDVRFSKKQGRVQSSEGRPTYVPTFYAEPSQFLPICQNRPRPRFYQQIPFSQQQLELKRKKFDSQFISKKESQLLNITKTNESEVTEDIIKCENSRVAQHLEDTLERGMEQNRERREEEGGTEEESGTLCESVFE